jgi:large subunit ribosomal protein L13
MMAPNTVKTFSPKPRDIERRWYVVDADGAVLGRLASEVAKILRGKHKPIFAPHMDTGDHVIVVNAKRVRLTGGKEEKKVYQRHSGYPGGLNRVTFARMIGQRPVHVVEKAIRGMLPKNRLGRQMARKLAVYEGPEHPHQAQKPTALPLGEIPKWEGLPKPKPKPQPQAAPAPRAAPRRKEPPKAGGARKGPEGKTATAAAPRTGKASAAKSPRSRAGSSGTSPGKKPEASPRAKASGKSPAKSSAGRAPAPAKAPEGEEKSGSKRRSRAKKKTEKES